MTKPNTLGMRVDNIAFLLDRLAADAPPNQQIRELTQNAIEAVQRRWRTGNSASGMIRWDVDWDFLESTGHFKLSITDNGDGMTPEEMEDYLNSLAVEGANRAQALEGNFGVGAKITALHSNPLGVVYMSWQGGRGAAIKLHRDDERGEYGLDSFDLGEDGFAYWATLRDDKRPKIIDQNGTKVTLLGQTDEENTCSQPEGSRYGETNWLYKYLNTRYFRLPENLTLQVRMLKKDPATWPAREPPPSDKTFNFETIRGMENLLVNHASKFGSVKLSSATVHWWLFDDQHAANKKMSPRALTVGHAGLVFQNELYNIREGNTARRTMAAFGIIYGSDHVVLYVEPRNGERRVHADTGRGRVLINGEDIDEAGWWEKWGAEFQEKMPAEIRELMERLIKLVDRDPEGQVRERIRERLHRIKALMKPSRLRRKVDGQLMATGPVAGGQSPPRPRAIRPHTDPPRPRRGNRGGVVADDYLAGVVASGGVPAEKIQTRPQEPEVHWVTTANNTRVEGELEDLGAEIPGDPRTYHIIKANLDFRGVQDLIQFFASEFNSEGNDVALAIIQQHVLEWIELQLIEAVMTVRNLEDGKLWTKQRVEQALSTESLTTVMMTRYQVVEKVRRALGNELTKKTAST